jgi:anti-sigma regulatory factor (Ser/Thr protein kinase)
MTDGSGQASDPELELSLPLKPEYVRTARHTVGALARLHGVPEDLVEDIKLAVSEACNTALMSVAGLDGEPIMVRAWAEPDAMFVEVLDRGPGPAKEILGDPEDIDTGDLPFEQALSLPLIRGLVDELALGPREDGGSALRMTVSLQQEG